MNASIGIRRDLCANGVVVYRSARLLALGVRHAFSTRIGGVSPAPFASLNLGNPIGIPQPDPDENLRENYRRLQIAIDLPGDRSSVHQVHGCGVAHLLKGADFPSGRQADAIVSDDPDRVLSIRTADCAALLLASADGSTIAGVHAGWRGVVAGVVPATVRAMRDAGHPPTVAAIFPCISLENFEVGLEVVEQFRSLGLPAREVGGGKGRVGVAESCEEQLRREGVTNIDRSTVCTYDCAADFFSHRRDRGNTGRMALLASAGRGKIQ